MCGSRAGRETVADIRKKGGGEKGKMHRRQRGSGHCLVERKNAQFCPRKRLSPNGRGGEKKRGEEGISSPSTKKAPRFSQKHLGDMETKPPQLKLKEGGGQTYSICMQGVKVERKESKSSRSRRWGVGAQNERHRADRPCNSISSSIELCKSLLRENAEERGAHA